MAAPNETLYTIELSYIGGRHYVTMPTSGFWPYIKCQIWGGAGGAGGLGGGKTGGSGAGGGYVEGTFPCLPGQLIEVFVGEGGKAGAAGIDAIGGAGGRSLIGYEGAPGGNSSPVASSGAGGGGGGSTVVVINCKPVAIAGGGGGGGGASTSQPGVNAKLELNLAVKSNFTMFDQGKGLAGQNSPSSSQSDAGGGGGGGGGVSGGGGGSCNGNNGGGNAGHCGSNGAYPENSLYSGEYCNFGAPGGYNNGSHPGNGVGLGGDGSVGGTDGGDGYAIITFYRTTEMYAKGDGEYKRVAPSVKIDNQFRPTSVYMKVDNVWKTFTSTNTFNFSQNSFKFGGAGLPYNATYSVPSITQPSYSIWGYYDTSPGCYFDDGNFYADFRNLR